MVNKTVTQLTELAVTPASDDELGIWDADAAAFKKITVANLLGGGTITGGGVIATGGFTLTVPATGTAALLATAQTFSALKTFNAGINLGNTTLANYLQSTWVPAITGSSSNPSATYTQQAGKYTRIGNVVKFNIRIIISTISGGGGDARISLPIAAAGSGGADNNACSIRTDGIDIPGTPINVIFQIGGGDQYGTIISMQDNASAQVVGVGAIANGDVLLISGEYFV